jgi:hypothetical protein
VKNLSIMTLLLFFGSCNVWRDFPNKSSDSYFLDQAEIFLDQFKFDQAIEKITPLLITQPKNPRVIRIAMLSYAGRAGLRSLDLILGLTDLGDKTFFMVFAEHFPGATITSVNDVRKSVEILENFQANPALRTEDMNLVAMFLYFSLIGVNLNYHAYNSNNELIGSFSACNASFTDEANTDIIQGLAKAIDMSSYLGSGGFSGALNSLTSVPIVGNFLDASDVICPGADPDEEQTCGLMKFLINDGHTNQVGLDFGQAGGPCP